MTPHVQAAVIGAGPTGTTAAIMLARRGVECLVLDRWPEVYPLPRAVHFDDEVFRILAGLGVGEQVRAISRPAAGMRLVDANLRPLAEFTRDPHAGPHGYPQANMFDQPDLERVLRARLAELPHARLRTGVEVFAVEQVPGGPAPVQVRYRDLSTGAELEVWADAVLGCDGANSLVRDGIGAAMEDLGFAQRWLVVDAHSPRPLDGYDGVQQVCDPDRAATFMMVTPGRYRWEFRLRDGEPDDLDQARVVALIRPWLGTVDPDKLTFQRRTAYTFRGSVARRWRDRRVFLLGDAAHLTPPFIGQGMCAGIRDAANLTWKLALVLSGRAGDRLLDTYEAERRPYARRVVRMAILVGWLMTGCSARTAGLRRAALRTVSRLPGVEQRVLDTAWPAFPAGPLTARRDRAAGRLCPQPRVRTADGDVPLDQALGDGFAVVTRRPDTGSAFDPRTRDFFEALGTRFVHCDDPALRPLFDRARAEALLVRPDRVVAASADRADLRGWRHLLEAAGITSTISA
ncbi:bifunctional 3-(3-hydroxy-phenyl)propionate/3-hydroxycinnamic acid hydroxylase MhpA [Phytohabitans rumicis]|uniref:3-(3-hydroxyphenyl)propionate hydroxylase n=1 Tax=Phytohabitans rumicis TaxID=1076125 RepID=A0A6V8KXD0_9ACTN|nr:bifunctional 3-(3-hydroxy-phenyl)propionate/3-hydroxycinnamic acid hydroxylase [Phytohabitans rumicis]GFJ86496.1 3-(3-hydroxyphenyl)propionate hydroxylase [Phytohabitans rumicis]